MFWEGKDISTCGRVFLIKLVFSSLLIYFLSFFQASKDIISKLESLLNFFLWGGNAEKHKVHWVAWENVHVYSEGRKMFGNNKS
uniref:Ribonuclease H protein At1g65750 family n=1 Tax=Cajanus cajan TaxID=3821 RepID=A0A151R751_CAJCA|nr:Putative ribonuclease H protein At1g65750 family [Cajanus cajan]